MNCEPQADEKRSTRRISLVSLAIALVSLLIGAYGAWQATVENAKADARPAGAVARYFVKWDGRHENGAPAPTAPGTALNIFQLTNVGRSATSIVGVEARSGVRKGAAFRQVGGDGRQLTGWNDSILVKGGETVTVAAHTFVWSDTCNERTFVDCPSMSVVFGDGQRIDLHSYVTDAGCTTTSSSEFCERIDVIGRAITKQLEESKHFCRLIVAEIDSHELAKNGAWKPAGTQGAEEICANHVGTF